MQHSGWHLTTGEWMLEKRRHIGNKLRIYRLGIEIVCYTCGGSEHRVLVKQHQGIKEEFAQMRGSQNNRGSVPPNVMTQKVEAIEALDELVGGNGPEGVVIKSTSNFWGCY